MHRIRSLSILLAALVCLAPLRSAPAASLFYTFELFGIPGGVTNSASDINNQGDVVGSFQTDPFLLSPHGFVRRGDSTTPIDAPRADLLNGTRATGINDAGQIVGRFVEFEAMIHGFILEDGVITQIDAPGSLDTELLDINNHGVIVGRAWFTTTGGTTAFILDEGNYTFFRPESAFAISANGINDLGNVVGTLFEGGFKSFALIDGIYMPFSIPTIPGQIIEAWGINDRNQIAGTLSGGIQAHGFVMDSTGIYQIDVPGADSLGTRILGINDAGQLVGNVDWPGSPSFLALVATPCIEASSTCIEAPRISDPVIDLRGTVPEPRSGVLLLLLVPALLSRASGPRSVDRVDESRSPSG